jgi:polyisoprenoid-binding protein YceI
MIHPPKRGILRTILVVSSLMLALSPCGAQTSHARSFKIQLDPAQTEIQWKVRGLHTIHGTFKLKDGEFLVNQATGVAEGEILVDATSSQLEARDKKMLEDVLDSNRYPGLLFHPTNFQGVFPTSGTQETAASGTFNIHGQDHPLQMPLKLQVDSENVVATTHFVIPYVAWGMKNPSTFFRPVSKQVEVQVKAKGTMHQVE